MGDVTASVEHAPEQLEKDAHDEFSAGFDGKEVTAPPPTEPSAEQKVDVAPEPEVPEPKVAIILDDEYQKLVAKAAEIDTVKQSFQQALDKAFGKMGAMEQQLKAMQGTPDIEITPDLIADIESEFPGLGDPILKSLTKFAGALKRGGSSVDTSQIENLVRQQLTSSLEKVEGDLPTKIGQGVDRALLSFKHPTWEQDKDSDEFWAWVGKLPAEEQEKAKTAGYREAMGFMDRYAEVKAAKATADATRKAQATAQRNRLEAAVTPKGTTGAQQAPATADDEFRSGFNS